MKFCMPKPRKMPMPEINLPFGEAVKRSFNFAFNHIEAFVKIALMWGILACFMDYLTGFPSLCTSADADCAAEEGLNFYVLVMFVGGISTTVSYITYVITREENKSFLTMRLGKKDFKYIWALLKLIFAGILISVCIGMFLGGLCQAFGLGEIRRLSMIFTLLSFFIVGIFLSRYCLVFPAIALENKEITFEKSYQMTKGNMNAVFWGLFVMSLPMMLTNMIVFSMYFAIGSENLVINLLFSFVTALISLFNDALKGSYLAHIYQYFMYFYRQAQNREEVLPQ